jgi:trehalose-6-phosphatase
VCKPSLSRNPVAFLGDDITDEAAFIALNARARPNLTALVKPNYRETAAALWLIQADCEHSCAVGSTHGPGR